MSSSACCDTNQFCSHFCAASGILRKFALYATVPERMTMMPSVHLRALVCTITRECDAGMEGATPQEWIAHVHATAHHGWHVLSLAWGSLCREEWLSVMAEADFWEVEHVYWRMMHHLYAFMDGSDVEVLRSYFMFM